MNAAPASSTDSSAGHGVRSAYGPLEGVDAIEAAAMHAHRVEDIRLGQDQEYLAAVRA